MEQIVHWVFDFFTVLCSEIRIALAKCLSWFFIGGQVNMYIIHDHAIHNTWCWMSGFYSEALRLVCVPSQGSIVLVFRGKYSVLVSDVGQWTKCTAPRLCRGLSCQRRRAYLSAVIYFGLEMRLFFKGKMFVCMYVLENWTFYMKTLNAQRPSLKPPLKRIPHLWLLFEKG